MNETKELPVVQKRKIDLAKFEKLAKKVRESFEEEAKYLQEKEKTSEHNPTAGFLQST